MGILNIDYKFKLTGIIKNRVSFVPYTSPTRWSGGMKKFGHPKYRLQNQSNRQAVQAVVKMFRLVGEDKEYGVITIGAVFPFSERAQGRIPFFCLRCFELAFLLSY